MEQKQLDELEESFFGEEFIEEESEQPETKLEPELRLKKVQKEAVKKSLPKKTEKTTVKKEMPYLETKKEVVIEKVEKKMQAKKGAKEDKETLKTKDSEMQGAPLASEKKETETKSAKEHKPLETSPTVDPWGEEESSGLFKQASTWKALTGITLILLALSIFTQGFDFAATGSTPGSATVSLEEAGDTALGYVNSQLLQPPFVAVIESSEELDNLYKVSLSVAGQTVDSYVTKDGKFFFPQGFEMGVIIDPDAGVEGTETEASAIDVSVDDDPVLGNEDALVTIVEFSDFQCPFCKKANDEALSLVKENYVKTGKVKLVFRDFPLEFHPEAEVAALAAECADEQGKFWEYHDVLFANQDSLGDANYKVWAEELGLDTEQFNDCYKSLKYLDEVRSDLVDGQKYGVSGTPAFFVDGRLISGAQPYSVFKQEIENALAAKGSLNEEAEAQEEPELAPEEEPEEVKPVDAPDGEAVEVTLNAKKWIFNPSEVTVKKGSKILLTIVPSDLEFTFAVPGLGVEKEVSGVTEVELTAGSAGSFEFICSSCEEWRGMKGTLVVE